MFFQTKILQRPQSVKKIPVQTQTARKSDLGRNSGIEFRQGKLHLLLML